MSDMDAPTYPRRRLPRHWRTKSTLHLDELINQFDPLSYEHELIADELANRQYFEN